MNIWQLLFGFDGRISRMTYIVAITALSLIMFAMMLAAAALVTGDPLSSELWEFRRENIGVWGPIYAGVLLVSFWPGLALVAKRLHDRGYSMWIGVAFYLGIAIVAWALLWFGQVSFDVANAPKPSPVYMLVAILVLWPVSMWFIAQLMFMRGVVGPNAFGPDPLAGHPLPGHEPRTFWNVVFNPDGRMSRKTWWLMFVSLVVLFLIWGAAYGAVFFFAMSGLPQSSDPAWLASPEGQRALMRATLPGIIVMSLLLYLLLWPALAAGTKRLHDRGRSGWVLASYYVPFALMAMAGSMMPGAADNGGAAPAGPGLWLMLAAGVIFLGLTLWFLVELGFLKGKPGNNAYGPDTQTA
jgi:uncharacterized membrane protein YhaH (DUF805 family)